MKHYKNVQLKQKICEVGFQPPVGLMAAHTIVFYALQSMNVWFCRLVKINLSSSMTQLSFRATPILIDADITEISACQKCRRTDKQKDGFLALYSKLANVPALSCRLIVGSGL